MDILFIFIGIVPNNSTAIESIEYINCRQFVGYHDNETMLRVTTTHDAYIKQLSRYMLDDSLFGVPYEDNINPRTRYMTSTGVCSGCWVSVDTTKITPIDIKNVILSANTHISNIIPSYYDAPIGNASRNVLSFDIECISPTNGFPVPQTGAIITIACMLCQTGERGHVGSVVFQLHDADRPEYIWNINGTKKVDNITELVCFVPKNAHKDTIADSDANTTIQEESALLRAFCNLIIAFNPDIITGYNVMHFDFSYIFQRATVLGVDMGCIGCNGLAAIAEKSYNERERTENVDNDDDDEVFRMQELNITIPGRAILDMYAFIRAEKKFDSYKLNAVAALILGTQKVDMPYFIILPLYTYVDNILVC